MDVDVDELNKTNFSSEEERQQHQEKFKDFFEKYHQQQAGEHTDFFSQFENQRERKKSKAQQEKEKKLAEAEKLLNTDINKLFKDLAKLIHPDREQDPTLRDKKEALMKELSNARDSMNIAEILRIKLLVDNLIPNNQSVLSFNDATIKRFVTIIKTKIQELENTVAQKLYAHPLLEDLNLRHLTTESIKKYISKEVKHSKHLTNSCEVEIDELLNNPKYIKAIIDDYIDMNGLESFWR
jgi:phage-related minor tail protein